MKADTEYEMLLSIGHTSFIFLCSKPFTLEGVVLIIYKNGPFTFFCPAKLGTNSWRSM